MTATQTRIRHGTNAECAAATPASSELVHNTTNGRIHIGDAVTLGGGWVAPTINDIQTNAVQYAAAGGTADALTFAVTPVPAAWVTGMSGKFKATAANTGSATGAITGLSGTKTFKKMVAGSLTNLAAGDFFNGGCYDWFYDGTYLVITSTLDHSGGLVSVSQGDLNTSTGTISGSAPSATNDLTLGGTTVTLPGGAYGFFPQTKDCLSNSAGGSSGAQFWATSNTSASYVTALTPTTACGNNSLSSKALAAQQRYITSSPPFDLGDGEMGGFIYLLLNAAGEAVASYAADVPPWAYNGPTRIRADKKCPVTGKKYRRVMVERSLEEVMDGAKIVYEFQEITQAIKNADMGLIPHPFGVVPPGHTVVLLNPMDNRLKDLIEYQNAGAADDVLSALLSGKIYADNVALEGRKGPPGVMQARLRFRYSKG